MDQAIRNRLRNVVTQCRKLLEEAVAQVLQGQFGIYASGTRGEVHVDDDARMTHLSGEDRAYRHDLLGHLAHIKASGSKPRDALDQLIREIAFTHLNRLCAYKMMEARGLMREAVSRGLQSQGFLFYLADHPDDEQRYNTGQQDVAYRYFLDWLGGTLSEEIGVLFNPNDPANRLYPPQRVLDDVLALINDQELAGIWSEDETIGWVYQYFTPKELRDQARKESAAPRNSYELAFRNQFFTPRYVVEFLTDNTLGRIWYEMRRGETKLTDQCRYMVRRPNEVFLEEGQAAPQDAEESSNGLSQEELLKQPVYIPHRPKKDPRDLKILDPACGSGHFLLYCFDLLQTIYEEAYDDPDLEPLLKRDYSTFEDLQRAVPGLILRQNLHGIDIGIRSTQIAALALWLRCQRAYQAMGLRNDRPQITRSHIVCAEPMPGETDMLQEFVGRLQPRVLGQLVEVVFDKMKLAGEAGSLLKIEEEIADTLAEAKKQWLASPKVEQLHLWAEEKRLRAEQLGLFDVSDITDEEFWHEAETRVFEALHEYARHATNGPRLQRQLFAEDTTHGFAFVELCRKRFDVVLMNPPFGDSAETAKSFCDYSYPTTKADLGFSFVERGLHLTSSNGRLGAITSRVLLANHSLEIWRTDRLISCSSLESMVDLGYGVLDDALVECAMYVIQSTSQIHNQSFFLRLLDERNKAQAITNYFEHGQKGRRSFMSWRDLKIFEHVPGRVLCYWLPNKLLGTMANAKNLISEGGNARHGLQTTDDFRFLRLAWEVPTSNLGRAYKWCFFAKGGEYQPFWDDLHLTLNWEDDGSELKAYVSAKSEKTLGVGGWSRWINAWDDYFKEGLTFPERTTSDFSPRILPSNCIFSTTGEAIIFQERVRCLSYLAGSYTRHFKLVVDAFVGSGDSSVSGSAANHYRSGLINAIPPPCRTLENISSEDILYGVELARSLYRADETSRYFVASVFADSSFETLKDAATQWSRERLSCAEYLIELSSKSEISVAEYLEFDEVDAEVVNQIIGPHPHNYVHSNRDNDEEIVRLWNCSEQEIISKTVERIGASRQITKKSFFGDRRLELICHITCQSPRTVIGVLESNKALGTEILIDQANAFVSYVAGCSFGRWDVRYVCKRLPLPTLPDPFAPLPVCSPGMLQGTDGLPLTETPEGYPLRIDWDGILVDDPDHQDDVIRRVRDVLELIWKDRADAIEKEACEILGVKNLRDYFRKPGKGGFWDDHVSRYSKSRRKAPIYWLLQSSKKNYALWLYYHRLDKDLLFKALLHYVEPKIRLEESRLEPLRAQRAEAGTAGRGAKTLETAIERQEDFISELRDFEDKLRRVANLHLEPDLNDGVVLNIAPLRELVPWKEATKYWDELLAGKYEWSSIGKQLREKGIVHAP